MLPSHVVPGPRGHKLVEGPFGPQADELLEDVGVPLCLDSDVAEPEVEHSGVDLGVPTFDGVGGYVLREVLAVGPDLDPVLWDDPGAAEVVREDVITREGAVRHPTVRLRVGLDIERLDCVDRDVPVQDGDGENVAFPAQLAQPCKEWLKANLHYSS